MAYNPYGAVSNIYKLKGQWDTAHNAGDENAKKTAAQNAQQYYQELRDNGYGDVADELSKSNYTQAKSINDKWAKMGKTSTRDYLYSLGKSYGMTSGDVDNLIGWDNQTKEVSFGGKKIGTPDTIVDGVSYWSDTSVLDNAFNDYVGRSGTTRDKTTAVNQENEGLFKKYNQAIDDVMNTNPFKTDEAKAILGKYDLAGLYARDNAVASGGATNGGNIDSYSAANAMRQQSALINQGQMAVLDARQQKIDNIRGILSDMGVNIDRVFNQDETAKNNEADRTVKLANSDNIKAATLKTEADVTGNIPIEWTIKNDPVYSEFLNEDGSFKKEKEGVDIQALINEAKASGDTERANKLSAVRTRKIYGNYSEFGKYVNEGDLGTITPQQTLAGKESAANISETAANNAVDRNVKTTTLGETVQNNAFARLLETANLIGYAPTELTIKSDPVYSQYLNEDGTFKKEQEGVDIQALIDYYKSQGDTETATKLSVVRARKIIGNYGEFGKYFNEGDLGEMKPIQTQAGKEFDVKAANEKLGITSNVEIAKAGYLSNETIAQINADVQRDGFLSNETIARINADTTKAGYLSNETIAQINADLQRDGFLSNETIAKIQADTTKDVAQIQADTTKAGYLSQETIAKIQADVQRDGFLSNETIARINADTTKAGYLSNETIAKINADLQRDGFLSNETIAKINADVQRDGYAANVKMAEIQSSSGNKPSLTAAQARDALKGGEVNQGTIDAYNYHYNASYTVDNPPKWDKDGNLIKTALTDAEVKSWVDKLNKEFSNEFGEKYPGKTAIDKTDNNTYKKGDADASWIVKKVSESGGLTDEQKQYLLIDMFGISPNTIKDMLNDKHYDGGR